MTGLQVRQLSFAYGRRQVLTDAGFDTLQPGRLTALIGPNAAGKSTLFRVLAGLLTPKSGTVTLGDEDLARLPSRTRLRRVLFMPQFFSANAALTVFDVVMMARKNLEGWRVTPEDMEAVGAALHAADIGHLSEAYVGELSGGQSQLVSVAQALIRRAEVYLFDEPTSALDLRHQLDVLKTIRREIRIRNAVGVVALHDLNLASRFADHLLLMSGGRIVAEGPPDSVLRDGVLADVYGVAIEITPGPRSESVVHAYPS